MSFQFSLSILFFIFWVSTSTSSHGHGTINESFSPCEEYELHQHPVVAPLLTDGSDQTVLRFDLFSANPCQISRFVLSLEGTTNVADLKSLKIIQLGKENRPDQVLVSSENIVQRTVSLELNHLIQPGTCQFAVSCAVSSKTNLLNKFQILVDSVELSDGTRVKSQPLPPMVPARAGYCIHRKKQFNCHTFRIPAIAKTTNGTLLAVYDMRFNSARDLQEHIDIGLSRSTDHGQTWSDPVSIMDMQQYGGKPEKENGCSDPGILVDPKTGEIFVMAVWTHGKPNTHQWVGRGSEPGFEIGVTAQFMVVRSNDDGKTWSKPENWTTRLKKENWWLFAPAPGNGIALQDGNLVMPTQGRDETGRKFSNLMVSRDHGNSWQVSSPARYDTSECTVVELSDGRLLLCMRDDRNRREKGDRNGRAVSVTSDFGASWNIHSSDHSALPEPVCMASMIGHKMPDGRKILFFSNPNDKHRRRKMTIKTSLDDGRSWPMNGHLLLDELGGAYSSLVVVDDDTLGILYESSKADLVFQKIDLDEIVPKE